MSHGRDEPTWRWWVLNCRFPIRVDKPGVYRLDARVDGPNVHSDSFFVTVGGEPVGAAIWDIPVGWTTTQMVPRGDAVPALFSLEPGIHSVRFYLREPGAKLDSMILHRLNSADSPAWPGELIQAESATHFGNFMIKEDLSASGGQYVSAESGPFMSTPGADFVEFHFTLPVDGSYLLNARVDGPNPHSDSFFVTIDGSNGGSYLWDIPQGWQYSSLTPRGQLEPEVLQLAAGNHVIRFHQRESNARLDAVVLTPRSTFDSPAVAGQRIEAETGQLSGGFQRLFDLQASQEQYVAIPSGPLQNSLSEHYVEFYFEIFSAGDYRLDARVDGPDPHSDSFYVTVDQQPPAGLLWDITPGWNLQSLADRGDSAPTVLTLDAGLHRIRIYQREAGAGLDWIMVVALN